MLFDLFDRSRVPTEHEVEHVKWHLAEASLQVTESDVFVIFDCCYAGDAGRAGRLNTRAFEFLAATSAGSTTKSPGPKSFTSGLIWALNKLNQERTRFTTSELTNTIKQCPEFPQDQVPVLSERNAACIERIILTPLSEDGTLVENLLILKFVLDRYPEKDDVVRLAQGFTHMVKTHGLLFRRVIWGGIHSDSPWSLYSPQIIHGSGDATAHIEANHERHPKSVRKLSFHARMAFMCVWARLPRGLVQALFADQWLAIIFLGFAVFIAFSWWQF